MNVRRSALILGFFAVSLFVTGTARAQEKPHNGLAMGYPAAVGFLWNVSDRLALWPELTDVRRSSSTSASHSQDDNNAIGAGIRLLLFLGPVQSFRPYIAPQFDYGRSRSTFTSTIGNSTVTGLATTTSTYSGAASFGAQYSLSARFGVFGEAGIEYEHEKATGSLTSQGNVTGTRSAVGIMVFF